MTSDSTSEPTPGPRAADAGLPTELPKPCAFGRVKLRVNLSAFVPDGCLRKGATLEIHLPPIDVGHWKSIGASPSRPATLVEGSLGGASAIVARISFPKRGNYDFNAISESDFPDPIWVVQFHIKVT